MGLGGNLSKPVSVKGGERQKPRFRIQEAILILRQGKSHPLWREAAWHLIEHAGKDTQLLLEAQRDLIEGAVVNDKASPYRMVIMLLLAGIAVTAAAGAVWKVVEHLKSLCG